MIKDSGHRTEFATGAVRDMKRGVGRMDLLPWYGIMEVSKHCEEGAEKYGEHNVDKGIPLHSLCDSAARHLAKFIAGEMDEDHLRAATWNLLWALNQRTTHPELDDLYSHKEKVEKEKESLKENKEDYVEVEEPTAIEPLSRELLLGMNGRFVYLMQSLSFGRPNKDMSDFVPLGWVRIKIIDDDIFIVSEDENQNAISEQKFDPSWMNCYVTTPLAAKKE